MARSGPLSSTKTEFYQFVPDHAITLHTATTGTNTSINDLLVNIEPMEMLMSNHVCGIDKQSLGSSRRLIDFAFRLEKNVKESTSLWEISVSKTWNVENGDSIVCELTDGVEVSVKEANSEGKIYMPKLVITQPESTLELEKFKDLKSKATYEFYSKPNEPSKFSFPEAVILSRFSPENGYHPILQASIISTPSSSKQQPTNLILHLPMNEHGFIDPYQIQGFINDGHVFWWTYGDPDLEVAVSDELGRARGNGVVVFVRDFEGWIRKRYDEDEDGDGTNANLEIPFHMRYQSPQTQSTHTKVPVPGLRAYIVK
ncbi:hypothetical protein HDU76_000898, partial [Blyttiomyces sp. JEL0837]